MLESRWRVDGCVWCEEFGEPTYECCVYLEEATDRAWCPPDRTSADQRRRREQVDRRAVADRRASTLKARSPAIDPCLERHSAHSRADQLSYSNLSASRRHQGPASGPASAWVTSGATTWRSHDSCRTHDLSAGAKQNHQFCSSSSSSYGLYSSSLSGAANSCIEHGLRIFQNNIVYVLSLVK